MQSTLQRPTIGFLAPGITAPIVQALWPGLVEAAREFAVNLRYFAGETVWDQRNFRAQANILYELITPDGLDGLINWSSTIYYNFSPEEIHRFQARYHPLPIVCIGKPVAGCPTVMMDNAAGMRELLAHLITGHGYSRLAFIRGPASHQYAQERYHAYVQGLRDSNLPVSPALVTPPLDWIGTDGGAEAIRILLDERRLRPGQDVEVLIAVNDSFALSAIRTLNARGIRVPEELAVVGFNDVMEGRLSTPALTTVAPQFFEQGRQAVTMLLALLAGQPATELTRVPSKLVVRRSCGCFAPIIARAVSVAETASVPAPTGDPLPPISASAALSPYRQTILAAMLQAAGSSDHSAPWAEQVVEALRHDLDQGRPAKFLPTIEALVSEGFANSANPERWHDVLSALRCQSRTYLTDQHLLTRAEDLWQQARILIGEASTRHTIAQQWRIHEQIRDLGALEDRLGTTFDLDQILTILAEGLPGLGIMTCVLALYEDPQPYAFPQPIPSWSRVCLACVGQERRERQFGELRMPTVQVLTTDFFPTVQCAIQMVEPLYFREAQLGFVVFGLAHHAISAFDGVYETLRRDISSTLQGTLLMQRVHERSAELIRQKYIWETFLENVPDSIYFKNCDSRITHANKAHAKRLGLTDPSEEIGKSDFDFFPEPFARLRYAQEQEIIRTGQPILAQEELNGEGHWDLATKMPLRDEHGAIIGTFGISRDITPLKQVEAFLRKLEKAMETTDVGITISDPDGRIVYVNPAEAQMHGYTVAELLGQPANIFAPPGSGEPARQPDIPPDVSAYWRRERLNRRKDGSIFPVQLISNPIMDADGQRLGRVTVCGDISERKQAEQALLAAHAELQDKNRQLAELNASKDKFFSIIAHDLKSPFTSLLGFSQLIDEYGDQYSVAEIRTKVRRLRTSAEQLYALLENLLTWSRIQQGAMEYDSKNLDLTRIVTETVALFLPRAEQKHVTLRAAIARNMQVWADDNMVQTVFRNLISNALKFTSAGGIVTITVQPHDEQFLEVAVADTGIGMDSALLAQLFRIGAWSSRVGTSGERGTGLGLHLCKDLVEKNGGVIWVESEVGTGTTFRFTLPTAGSVRKVNTAA